MEVISTAIEFVSKDSFKFPATADVLLPVILFLLGLVAVSVLLAVKKKNDAFYICAFVPIFVLAVGGLFVVNTNSALALNNPSPDKIFATINEEQGIVEIDKSNIKHFDTDCNLTLYSANIINNSQENIGKWQVNLDGDNLYNNNANMENIFSEQKIIESGEHEIELSSDILVDVAKNLIGNQCVSLSFAAQYECGVSGSVEYTTKTDADNLEGIEVSFIDANDEVLSKTLTDAQGNFNFFVKQGSQGHVHFGGKVAAYETDNMIVNKHTTIDPVVLTKKASVLVHDKLSYNETEQTGLELNDGCELVSGDVKATNIGVYSATVKPKDGYAWDNGSIDEQIFDWSIVGAYARHNSDENSLTFLYGSDYNSDTDELVFTAEKATEKSEIPWTSLWLTTKKVIFDETFKDYPVSQSAWWFEGAVRVASFENMENLNLQHLDKNKRGTESMFNGCWAITNFDLTSLNLSNDVFTCWMFYNCKTLKTINLSNLDASSVKDMNHMFANCPSLESINFTSFKTSNVDNMSCMFDSCISLTSLDLSSFKTPVAGNTSYMFSMPNDGTSKLESITFGPGFDTTNVTEMENMFYYCSSLKSLDLSNFNTSKVYDFSSFLDSCSQLKGVTGNSNGLFDFSNFNFSGCANVSWFMSGCQSATQVITPNSGFKQNPDTHECDAGGMMAYCSSLQKVDCSLLDTSLVTSFYQMFCYDKQLSMINSNVEGEFNVKNLDASNATTLESMFDNNLSMKKLFGPKNEHPTKTCILKRLCYNAILLELVDMRDFNLDFVSTMEMSFSIEINRSETSNLETAYLCNGTPGKHFGECNFNYTFSNVGQTVGVNALKTVYCEPGADWGFYAPVKTIDMFGFDECILGGNGTVYDSASPLYARDDTEGQPGYFTAFTS